MNEITTYCRNKVVASLEYEAVIEVNLIFCPLEERELRTPYYVARHFYFPT